MSELTFTQGDTAPAITGALTNEEDGSPFSLVNVDTVRFQMRKPDDKRYTVNATATKADIPGGVVTYGWQANDLDVPGEYLCQWELHYLDGKIQTTQPVNTITIRRQ